jgi:hypothetical protein
MYINELEIDSYINCLWTYFQSYLKSIKKNIKYQEYRWLKVLEKSKLGLNKELILKYMKDPDYIFKITKYKDCNINKLIILKLRFYICLYWLNFLLIKSNDKKDRNIIQFNSYSISNWTETIDNLISIFESRNQILILERDKIYNNLQELERIRIKCPHLSPIHHKKLENQLKALRYILNLELSDELRTLNNNIKKLDSKNFCNMIEIFERIDMLKTNIYKFLSLFNYLSEELLTKHVDPKIKIFEIKKENFIQFIGANLQYQKELLSNKEIIYNTKSLRFNILEKLKLVELKINCEDSNVIFILLCKANKLVTFIKKVTSENMILNLEGTDMNDYMKLQKSILDDIINVNSAKERNFNIISDLEKNFKYNDLKDLDLEFYYQFLTHVNQLIIAIKKGTTLCIDDKKYLSNDTFNDRKKFDILIKTINSQYVSKKEFNIKINEIETRITNIESNNSPYIMGTMVISLISLSIWKKLIRFREDFF